MRVRLSGTDYLVVKGCPLGESEVEERRVAGIEDDWRQDLVKWDRPEVE
jgi:hypothetical protein